jgi:hypothetical protein
MSLMNRLSARHDARNDVEGDQPFLGVGFAIDREGDADAAKQQLGFASPVVEHVGRHLFEPARQFAIGGAHATVGFLHLVEGGTHLGPPARGRSRATLDRVSCALSFIGCGPRSSRSLICKLQAKKNPGKPRIYARRRRPLLPK